MHLATLDQEQAWLAAEAHNLVDFIGSYSRLDHGMCFVQDLPPKPAGLSDALYLLSISY